MIHIIKFKYVQQDQSVVLQSLEQRDSISLVYVCRIDIFFDLKALVYPVYNVRHMDGKGTFEKHFCSV